MSGLSIKRRSGQRVVCRLANGERMVITVGRCRPGSVQLLFRAPKNVTIARDEIAASLISDRPPAAEVSP